MVIWSTEAPPTPWLKSLLIRCSQSEESSLKELVPLKGRGVEVECIKLWMNLVSTEVHYTTSNDYFELPIVQSYKVQE